MENNQGVLTHAVVKLLKPLIKLLLSRGIGCVSFCELVKVVYVDVANTEFVIPGKKQSISRVSTLTGLTRREVSSVVNIKEYDLDEITQQINRAARVVTGWVRDSDFHTKRGQPKELVFENEEQSFSELVKRHSGDIPARAIADELLRVGVIESTKQGKLKLKEKAYIPGKDIDKKINILGDDVSDLIKTISHNIQKESETSFFQRKVFYNAIPKESLEKIREQVNKKAQNSLEDIDKLLVKHDSDMNSKLKEKGKCRAGVGIYYFEEINNEI